MASRKAKGIEVHTESRCRAPLGVAFAYVDDHRNVPRWMFGVDTFTPVDGRDHGLGALFDVRIHLGVPIRTRIEITGWEQDRLLELTSVTGFEVDSRWTFTEEGDHTVVGAVVTYHLPFGPAGRVMGRVMEPAVALATQRSSAALVREIEAAADRTT